jgi:hypothetical protein
MAAVIDARREVLFVLQPVSKEESDTLHHCGFRKHHPSWATCDCPLCHMHERYVGEALAPDAWWTTDVTCAQATGLQMTRTASILVDRARDIGRRSVATTDRFEPVVPYGQKLFDFQKAGVRYALDCFERGSGVLIADEMGLGKSPTSICTATAAFAKRVLVICPAPLRVNWQREIWAWARQRATILDTATDIPAEGPAWAVTNPQKLIRVNARDALKLVQRAKADVDGNGMERFFGKKLKQFVVLWVGGLDVVPAMLGSVRVFTAESFEKSWQLGFNPCIVHVKTPGEALLLARKFGSIWTHIVGKKCEAIHPEARAGGLGPSLVKDCDPWDVLILDEAQLYGSKKSLISKQVLGLSQHRKPRIPGVLDNSKRLVALSGTPFSNRPKELGPLIDAVSPQFKQTGSSHYLMRYCGAEMKEIYLRGGKGKKKPVWTFDGASRLPELQARLRRQCMIRRKKSEVLKELPEQTDQILPLDPSSLQVSAEQENLAWLRDERAGEMALWALVAEAVGNAYEFEAAIDKLQDMEVARGLSIGEIASARKAIALSKVPLVIEHVRTVLESKRKVVVMAHHQQVVESIAGAFDDSVMLYGPMEEDAKQASIDAFQTGDARLFVGSLRAAGVGLTLTAADTMIFAEHDWNPAIVSQARARIHRIGQLFPVLYQHMVVEGTIEAMLVTSIIRKQRTFDAAMDKRAGKAEPYPRATGAQRRASQAKIFQWCEESSRDFDLRTMKLIREIKPRLMQRPPTDGEVWLVGQLRNRLEKVA